MDQFVDQSMETGVQTPKRPTFLTVICIISWVGCAFAILGSVYGYFSAIKSYNDMQQLGDLYGGAGGMMDGLMDSAKAAYDNAGINMAIGLICGILCLIGTIMMWSLKKVGFYLYLPGEILPAIAPFIFGGGSWVAILSGIVALIIGIVWVVLYALNLKHMK